MMNNDLLPKLTCWFAAHCDGEWEHDRGISITTTDNPGPGKRNEAGERIERAVDKAYANGIKTMEFGGQTAPRILRKAVLAAL